jgi:hypothetical protein
MQAAMESEGQPSTWGFDPFKKGAGGATSDFYGSPPKKRPLVAIPVSRTI